MPRFTLSDDPERINYVFVVDELRKFAGVATSVVVMNVSKPVGEVAVALLNAHPVLPTDSEAYREAIRRVRARAGRLASLGRSFEAGVHVGITLGDQAVPDAHIYRTPANNEAYQLGLRLGQQILNDEVSVL